MDYWKEIVARSEATSSSLVTPPDVKNVLLKHIEENPGIWYRELLRVTGISNGALTHHLRALEESDCIKVDRHTNLGKTTYYSVNVSNSESIIIAFLKNATTKNIIFLMIQHDFCSFQEIVESVKKSPSTISWHIKRLVRVGLVTVRFGERTLYSLSDRTTIAEVLSKFKESLLDKAVDSYTEILEDL